MKPRKNPSNEQALRQMQHKLISDKDPRAKHDAYWALRLQGHSDAYAKRAFRDKLPLYYKEQLPVSVGFIPDVPPEDIFVGLTDRTDIQVLAVMVRPDLTEEVAATAPPREVEYTIWSNAPSGFGLRVRPSGVRTYILMFRMGSSQRHLKLTLGRAGDLPLETARQLARAARYEALIGNDPRAIHKSGKLMREVRRKGSVWAGFPSATPVEY